MTASRRILILIGLFLALVVPNLPAGALTSRIPSVGLLSGRELGRGSLASVKGLLRQ